MKENNYELKITDKIEKWLDKISPNEDVFENVLEFLISELETNPFPRPDNPKLISVIKGLKNNNPPMWRIRLTKKLGLNKDYRLYYSIHKTDPTCYIITLDYSNVDTKDKKKTIDRLKKINIQKLESIADTILTP